MRKSDNDQLSMDLDVPVVQTEWSKWADPERRARQARAFLDRAELGPLPDTPWDRYGDGMEITRLNDLVYELFPTVEAVTDPVNRSVADELVCLTGAWFEKYHGAEWVNVSGLPSSTYTDTTAFRLYHEFRPALAFSDPARTFTAEFLVNCVIGEDREFFDVTVDIEYR